MAFHLIDMETWERKEHYKYYQTLVRSSYTLTANIHITGLLEEIKKRNLKFYPVFLYITSTAVNYKGDAYGKGCRWKSWLLG